ncbi:MAG: lipoprotein signal peptidase [Prevotella sp.]|nr:lipoprotein signal peptidase [Prevotella sp.]
MANSNIARRGWLAVGIVLAILIVDQVIKIWVKTHMTLHEQIEILSWFKIVFIENNGMAYGMEIGSKLVLSLFRIVAIGLLGYYLAGLVRRQARVGYIVCISMVLAGAAGNIFDSMFYGLIFNASSEFYVSYFVPFGTGYAPFLMGKVVDMFYFPLIVTTWPEWVPMVGGEPYVFFSPVFNFADSAISVGVVALLLFYRKEISELTLKKEGHAASNAQHSTAADKARHSTAVGQETQDTDET